jgi:histidinol dehydrogenase/sulfopropanediol 3-dehydrogenase
MSPPLSRTAFRISHVKAPQRDAQSDTRLVAETVAGILEAVRTRGDAAVRDFSARFDGVAAEHLQVHTRDPHATAKRLRNYGSLFVGPLASVVYSDKCCGTNHTLPTMGAGRYTAGLWVGSYVKVSTHQWLEPDGVRAVAPPAVRQSASEGLEGHRRAAARRLEHLQAGRA